MSLILRGSMATINPLIRTLAHNQPSEILLQCCYHYEKSGVLKDVETPESLLQVFKAANPDRQFTEETKAFIKAEIHRPFIRKLVAAEQNGTFYEEVSPLFAQKNFRDLRIALTIHNTEFPQIETLDNINVAEFVPLIKELTQDQTSKSDVESRDIWDRFCGLIHTVLNQEGGQEKIKVMLHLCELNLRLEILFQIYFYIMMTNEYEEKKHAFLLELCDEEKKPDLLGRLFLSCLIMNRSDWYNWFFGKNMNVNYANEKGESLLLWATKLKKVDVIHTLMDRGADIWQQDLRGHSPVSEARFVGFSCWRLYRHRLLQVTLYTLAILITYISALVLLDHFTGFFSNPDRSYSQIR